MWLEVRYKDDCMPPDRQSIPVICLGFIGNAIPIVHMRRSAIFTSSVRMGNGAYPVINPHHIYIMESYICDCNHNIIIIHYEDVGILIQ